MKLLALLAIALGLLSAGPADARHHHRTWQQQHSAVPMPKERPPQWNEHTQTPIILVTASGQTSNVLGVANLAALHTGESGASNATSNGSTGSTNDFEKLKMRSPDTVAKQLEIQLVLVGWWRLRNEEFWRR